MWIVIGIAIVLLFVFCVRKHFNNYVFIARNTTYIYEILSTDFKDRFPNEDVLLATSGVIDALKYVMEGSLPVDHIVTGAQVSEFGSCHLDLMNINMSDNPARECWIHDTPRILYFVMQLEALIFHVDTRVPPKHILSALKSKRNAIEKAIKTIQHKYKTQGAPARLKVKTYAFMNDEALAELRDELGIIRLTPEQQFDKLFQELIKQKHWKDIDPDIIKSIFHNAKGNVDAIKRFILISELHNLVGNNFVELAKSMSREYVLNMFALTLYRLGSELTKALYSAKTDEEVTSLGMRATMAFMSSILCQPSYLMSYFGLALLYSEIDKNIALEWCAKYKQMADKLVNTPDEELSAPELSIKESLEPEEQIAVMQLLSEHTTGLVPDGWEEDVTKSMSDKINELETDLLQKA